MKKLIIGLLVALLLIGCAKVKDNNKEEPVGKDDDIATVEQDDRITNLAYEVLNKYGIDFDNIDIDYESVDGESSKDTVNIYVKKDIDASDYYLLIANYIGSFSVDGKIYGDSMHSKELSEDDVSDNSLIGYLTINEIDYEINIIYSKNAKYNDNEYQVFKIGISEI